MNKINFKKQIYSLVLTKSYNNIISIHNLIINAKTLDEAMKNKITKKLLNDKFSLHIFIKLK